MTVRALYVAFLTIFAIRSFAQQGPASISCPATESAVREVDHQIWSAYKHRDVATLDRLIADDLIHTDDAGGRTDKRGVLAENKGPESDVHNETREKPDDFRVVFTNGVAILNFTRQWTDYDKKAGVSWSATVRTTRVLTCTDGSWKMVVYHETVIPNKNRTPLASASINVDDYVGRYRIGDRGELSVARVGDKLYETWAGEKAVEIFPGKYDTFFSREDGWVESFIRDKSGKVSGILYTHPDGDLEARKLP